MPFVEHVFGARHYGSHHVECWFMSMAIFSISKDNVVLIVFLIRLVFQFSFLVHVDGNSDGK